MCFPCFLPRAWLIPQVSSCCDLDTVWAVSARGRPRAGLCKPDLPGLPRPRRRPLRLVDIRGRGDPDQRGATRTRVAQESRRGARGLPATGNPSPNPSQTAAPASYRISGASEEGCLARAAEIRPLFPPGRGGCTTARTRPTAAPAAPATGSAGRARGQGPPSVCAGAGWAGGGSRARPGICVPLLPSGGSRAPWHGRFHPAAGGCRAGGDWQPQAGSPAKRCVFPNPRRARETLRVCLMGMDSWKTRRKVPWTSACTVLFRSQQTVQVNVR